MSRRRLEREISKMREAIERRGGRIHIDPRTPLELQRTFLKQVLACPDCCASAKQEH